MNCPKCNNLMPEGSVFCNTCGAPLSSQEASQPAPIQANPPAPYPQPAANNSESTLIDAYLGKKPEKMVSYLKAVDKNFAPDHPAPKGSLFTTGWLPFILGPLYYLYWKMYLPTALITGALTVLIVIFESFGIPEDYFSAIAVAFWVVPFPYFLIWDMKRKINKVKAAQPQGGIMTAVQKVGGTSYPSVLLIIPYFLAMIAALWLFFTIFNLF